MLEEFKKNLEEWINKLLDKIPTSVKAYLNKKHAKLLAIFYKYRIYYILTLVLLTVFATCFGIGWLVKANECADKAAEYEKLSQEATQWEKANKDAADFGIYMKRHNPNTFRR